MDWFVDANRLASKVETMIEIHVFVNSTQLGRANTIIEYLLVQCAVYKESQLHDTCMHAALVTL